MKTRNFCIFGVLFALLLTFRTYATAFAQNSSKSDTITLVDPKAGAGFAVQDFGSASSPVQTDSTICHAIFVQNKSGKILVLADVQTGGCNWTPIPKLPFVLLPNEMVSFVNVCFTAQPSTAGIVNGFIRINYFIDQTNYDMIASLVGYQIADSLLNKPCTTMTLDSNLFGPIIMDGDISNTATITSNRHYPITIRLVGDTIGVDFHATGITLPYTLKPLEVKTFKITFSPRSNVPVVKYRLVAGLRLFTSSNCGLEHDFQLVGVAIPPTDPNTPTDLSAGSTDVLAMVSDNSVTTQNFYFKNNGSTNLKITGVALKNGKSFAITNITPSNTLPFPLTPGQSMSITISMTTVTNGVYYDEVIITAENASIHSKNSQIQGSSIMNFPLQGLRKNGVSEVHNASASTQHVTLYPNPTHGSITIGIPGIHNAKIEVLDVLGKIITTATASEMWNWNSTAPAGTYVVHVSGTDQYGKTFQSYDRFIMEK